PWTATTWSLTALREWGLDAAVLGDTAERLAVNSRWEYDDLPYWGGEVDVCINAKTLANGVWLGVDMADLADWFLDHQLGDGGWNCEWVEGSTVSSFHSTLNALRGLLWYERAVGGDERLAGARRRGEQYLLERRLMFRRSTGDTVAPWVTRFSYPARWRFEVMRAGDYFREAAAYDQTRPDQRMQEAMDAVRAARQPDGSWLQDLVDAGRVWFEVAVPEGERSPWVTMIGTRVLDWWDSER
ncbi:MAG: squalene cyclase, partial [Pseudolysinimonas sp.]